MKIKQSLAAWIVVAVALSCLSVFAQSISIPVLAVEPAADTGTEQIPHLEDYDYAGYIQHMNKLLEDKLSKKHASKKDWALVSFVIKRDGTIANAKVSNSTGNEQFNADALKLMHSTKLPPLPEDAPQEVKTFHAFGWSKATRDSSVPHQAKNNQVASAGTGSTNDSDTGTSTDADADIKDAAKTIVQSLKESGLVTGGTNLANLEAVCNIAANSVEIIWIWFVATLLFGTTALFFIAGTFWWIHRLLLGRFPS
jgi:TonB family protein